MNGRADTVLDEMNRLRSEIGGDFCALGLMEGEERTLRWKLASGNTNERFRSMAERAGRGFGGSVAKVGRGMTLQVAELVNSRLLHEYPILLAENLRSAYAVPIFDNRKVAGILLAGDRKKRIYRPEERNRVLLTGDRISEILSGQTRIPKS